MEMQLKQNVVPYLKTIVKESQNYEQSLEVRIPDGMPDIATIVCAWGQPVIRSKEWRNDCILLSGGIMVWIMYQSEEQPEPLTIDAWVPFQIKWSLPDNVPEGKALIACSIRFVDARSVSPRRIMVRAGLSASAEALVPDESKLFVPENLPEDIELLQKRYPVRLPVEAGEKTFTLEENVNIPGEDFTTDALVYYSVTPAILDQKIVGNKIAFRGSGNLHLLFSDGSGHMHSHNVPIPFSQFAELDNVYGSDAEVTIRPSVTDMEMESDDEGILRVRCGITAQYLITDSSLITVAEDAYSISKNLQLTSDVIRLPAILEQRKEILNAEAVLPENISNIVDACTYADCPRVMTGDGQILIETQGITLILYADDQQSLKSFVSRWSSQTVLKGEAEISVSDFLICDPQVLTSGAGALVRTEIPLMVSATAEDGFHIVTGIQAGEDKMADPGRPSLILCRADGSGLWNIAKTCGSTMAAIRKANSIDGDPTPGQMLIIPVL